MAGGTDAFSHSVADAVLAHFTALPKNGKTQPHEHTVLAGECTAGPRRPEAAQYACMQRAHGKGMRRAALNWNFTAIFAF